MSASRICQTLHEEHQATVAFTEQLEAALAKYHSRRPDCADPALAGVLRGLPLALDAELSRHFDFEETRLFSHLASAGDAAIGAHLTDEHEAMRPLGARLVILSRQALTDGFDDARWQEFRAAAAELCERLLMHVQKEEMALLPLLEETLDPESDARLYDDYVGNA
jgi:hemerythrin-like domain-containing protein